MRGEDVTPKLREAVADGCTVLRVFGEVNWGGEWAFYLDSEVIPGYYVKMHAFLDLCESFDLYVEWTVLTYPDSVGKMRAKLIRAFGVGVGRANLLIELCNEAEAQGIDAKAAYQNIPRPVGVIMSSGYYLPVYQPHVAPGSLFMLDYVTVHTDRGDEWPRKAKDALELRDGFGDITTPEWFDGCKRPVIGDEPMGGAEANEPGRRSNVASDFGAHMAVGKLYSGGTTRHDQAGLEGRARRSDETKQADIAAAVREMWAAIPAEAQLGEYTRGGLDSLPIEWDGETASLRDYGLILGARAWVAVVRKRAGRAIVAKAGWRIVRTTGAAESPLVELERI